MQIRIHNEGWVYFISSMSVSLVLLTFFPLLGIILLLLSFYIYYFFRDPKRSIPYEDVIISPADGIITSIVPSKDPSSINDDLKFIKISIFLNIFNVHVNRMPTDGIIKKIEYIHGKFINATLDKSSLDNERNIKKMKKSNKDIIYITQIAGLRAREIFSEVKEKLIINKRNRFGII